MSYIVLDVGMGGLPWDAWGPFETNQEAQDKARFIVEDTANSGEDIRLEDLIVMELIAP